MSKTVYWPYEMLTYINIIVDGKDQKLPMTWNEGQIGIMLVFDTEESAKRYAKSGAVIHSGIVAKDTPA